VNKITLDSPEITVYKQVILQVNDK